jgi:hypothetical protein
LFLHVIIEQGVSFLKKFMPIDEDDDEENLFGMKGITNVG